MALNLDEEFTISEEAGPIWAVLREPAVVVDCLPGVELVSTNDDGSYSGTLTVQFGPTIAVFRGTARITVDDDARQSVITARGADKKGANRASAEIKVSVVPMGSSSSVNMKGSIALIGPLTSFVETGGLHIVRAMLADFAKELQTKVERPTFEPHVESRRKTLSGTRVLGLMWLSTWRRLRTAALRLIGRPP